MLTTLQSNVLTQRIGFQFFKKKHSVDAEASGNAEQLKRKINRILKDFSMSVVVFFFSNDRILRTIFGHSPNHVKHPC